MCNKYLLIPSFFILLTSNLYAAGFALKEQSGYYQGTSYAGATASKNIDGAFFNPASIGFTKNQTVKLDTAYLALSSKATNIEAKNAFGTVHNGASNTSGFLEDSILPSFAAALPISDNMVLGLVVNAPFGLVNNYSDNWAGRYHAIDSKIETINIAPIIAYRPIDGLSLALSPQIQYGYASISNAIDQKLLSGGLISDDAYGRVSGHDWNIAYNIGAVYDISNQTTIGLSYQSKITHSLHGKSEFDNVSPIIAGLYNIKQGGVSAKMNLPASVNFGISQSITDDITLLSDISWTDWSDFSSMRIKYNTGQADSVTTTNWNDSWFYAIGAKYKAKDNLEFRFGGAFDESPTSDEYRTARIPDSDRYWLSAGVTYNISDKISIDGGYSHVFLDNTKVDLPATGENMARGSIKANYDNSLDIFMLSLKAKLY